MAEPVDTASLERRALELAKQADFGPEATQVNAALTERSPANASAWKRLGRCHLEQRRFDEAVAAFRTALALNPADTIATNLLTEVRKRRALTPSAVARATTGFTAREFTLLETLAPEAACKTLAPRIDALFDALNRSSIAERIVATRQRFGHTGAKVYHADSCHPGGLGHMFAFQHGGRWEPQFNMGWFSRPDSFGNCFRAGIGFNLSPAGRDPDRAEGPERVAGHFERFQRALEKSWKRSLVEWMAANAGFLQYGAAPPATNLVPERAVEWLLQCRNPVAVGWIFFGRWLFLDRPDDAVILADRAKLARSVDDAFRALFPLWLAAYGDDPPITKS